MFRQRGHVFSPAIKVHDFGCMFTACVAKRAKVMFLQVSVILSLNTGGGVTPDASWDRSHGLGGGGLPRGRWTSPPLGQVQSPPWPGSQHLSPQHPGTMRRWAVRILLECILVSRKHFEGSWYFILHHDCLLHYYILFQKKKKCDSLSKDAIKVICMNCIKSGE